MISEHEPYCSIMEVTPSMAARWLEGNTHNRPLNQGHVERLAREITAGRWRLTHQGIAFSPGGVLLDGQHRLWAIVMADVPVTIRVFFNEPAENVEYLDGGLLRSAADRMSLSDRFGRSIDRKHLSVLRCMVRGLDPHQRLSYGEEADLLACHMGAIRFALEHLTMTERARGVGTAVTRGVIARAYYSVDHARLIHFCMVLRTGLATGPGDEPIIMLRDYLVQSEKGRNSLAVVREQYGKTERALKAHLTGETLAKLYAVTNELFPLPSSQSN
ncbi:MAG: hypothetical protein BWX88_03432 [Planctomycetes bacterium ADurb.Bin126]|nr:MAG: hypothetical protein BWX88_03432 [Planctomycetes bacterium ADurb.Bin126]HOD81757.1 hypothetical protein [Phycisphaerae bacterium]HQL74701.1 hypothetical protein [Phycisphaerae bacterium]